MIGGEVLVRCLIAQGVDTVFGMPGGHIEGIYDALYEYRDEIRHVLVRNEQAASLMADGYARASGRPGVCLVIPGPGASNAATGLGEAASASVPVLLITSKNEARIADKEPSKLFHGLDHMTFFAPFLACAVRPRRSATSPGWWRMRSASCSRAGRGRWCWRWRRIFWRWRATRPSRRRSRRNVWPLMRRISRMPCGCSPPPSVPSSSPGRVCCTRVHVMG
ncbi:MAG: thiamine pyrophosphate-binding protein [Planctomycetes bacterium]|nr:thiamine pyrophosphate-binding protein [Planctomycetota bacterium]